MRLEAVLFFFGIWIVYIASPIVVSTDSHFVIPTVLNIVRHGHADIDRYKPLFPHAPWAKMTANGHDWNVYPVGVPFMIVPMVWVIDRTSAVFGLDLEASALQKWPQFLELTMASLVTAACAALLFYYFRQRLSLPRSVLLGTLFAFGTTAYSTASRGMWQHGPAMLLIVCSVLTYERLPQWKTGGAILLGFLAGYSYAVRPSNLFIVIGFAVLLGIKAWRRVLPYLGGAVIGIAPLFVFSRLAFGTWMSPYYTFAQQTPPWFKITMNSLFGTLISPSRGLFVFSPVFLFVLARFLPSYLRRYPFRDIEILLAALVFIWWIGVSRWPQWWGGGSYGPRLLCEMAPCFAIFLIPVVENLSLDQSRVLTAVFLIAGVLSIGIHVRGATTNAYDWNGRPVAIDLDPQRVWSWKDPQFLYGLW